MKSLIGKEYKEIESDIKWKLLFEDMYLIILRQRTTSGRDVNLIGVSTKDLNVKWEVGGVLNDPAGYDGVVNIWIKNGQVRVGIWSGYEYTIDYKTGAILEEKFKE